MNTNRLALKITKILGIIIWLSLASKLDAIESAQSFASRANLATFEENKGQIKYPDGKLAPEVRFMYRSGNLKIFLLTTGLAYQLEKYEKDTSKIVEPIELTTPGSEGLFQTYRMDMELIGANPNPEIIVEGKSEDYTNYYQPDLIQTHSYQKITYKNIYPDIDWVIYTQSNEESEKLKEPMDSIISTFNSQSLKYDFIVRPGADPNQIKLKYKNAEQIYLDHNGNLILRNRLGDIREDAPLVFQNQERINANFILEGKIVRFQIEDYNSSQILIIDPQLKWSTYYGGNSTNESQGCNVDLTGNVFLYGYTQSNSNIAYNGFQNNFLGSQPNGFVVKFNAKGNRLWGSYYGINYFVTDAVVDYSNNIYLVGYTDNSTTNFSHNGHQNSHAGGSHDGLIVKFDMHGNRIWSSYYGGSGADQIFDCEIDLNNSLVFCGSTTSTSDIAVSGTHNNIYFKVFANGTLHANRFLVKMDSNGNRNWGTYYGLNLSNYNTNIALDSFNNIYLSGATNDGSQIFNPPIILSGFTSYLAKFNSNGTRLYGKPILTNFQLIGSPYNSIFYKGFLYCLLNPILSNPPTLSNGFQNTQSGLNDIIIVRLDTGGTSLWSSYCGGNSQEEMPAFAKDKYGNLYISGRTFSTTGIYYKGIDSTLSGLADIFVTKVSKTGVKIWSTYIGGNSIEIQPYLQVDNQCNLYISGNTNSIDNISHLGFKDSLTGPFDAFLMKISCSHYDTIRDTICQGDSLYYRSKYYTKAGFYTDSFLTWDICDSFITLHLTVLRKDTTYLYDTICTGTSYVWNGQNRTASGIYRDTLMNNVGCDSFLILHLHIKRTDTTHIYDTSCNNLPKTFNSQNLTLVGTYRDTLINSLGCDSHIFYHFIPKPIYETPVSRAICTGDSTLFGGKYRKLAGTYFDTLKTKQGCDSILKLSLSLNPLDTTRQSHTICRGNSYLFYSQSLTTAGTYSHKLTNRNNCDSTILLTLSVIDSSSYRFSRTLCKGQSLTFNNQTLTQDGSYRDTLTNSLGCDSFVTLDLSFGLVLYDTLRQTICAGQSYRGYSSPGTYRETFQSSQGCDSILTIYLTQLPATEYQTVTHTKCGVFFYGARTYTRNDSFTETIKNSLHCDSIVTKHRVFITEPNPKFLADKTIEFCEEIVHKGRLRTASFFTHDTIKSLEYPYCDSLYQPIYYRREVRPVLTALTRQMDTVIQGETTKLEVSGAQHYRWSNGDPGPIHRPLITESKTFEVKAWNLADCEESLQFEIHAIDQPLLDLPTAFSPNGDGLNDNFLPDMRGPIQIDYFDIYNRWGEKVYSYSPNSKGWDGSYQNQAAAGGHYTYTLRYNYLGRNFTRRGEVMLMR